MNTDELMQTEQDELAGRHLLFLVDGGIYSAPLTRVMEIIDVPHITRVPQVAHYVCGIINLRGKVVPVLDVRLKFNFPFREYDQKTCIIVLDMDGMQLGLIVDQVLEVATMQSSRLARPPQVGDPSALYLSSVTQMGDRVVLSIDFDKFFQDDIGLAFG